ncbi:MAG: class I SAM-dependent methyltransferase [Thermoanaerobaculia bacterium]
MGTWTRFKTALLESPVFYRLWQRPWANAKLEPLRRHNDLVAIRRVLDLGCGPGTNSLVFEHCDYVGVDINPRYIEQARQRFHGEFIVADLRDLTLESSGRFDFILLNSLLHHIDDAGVRTILSKARELLTDDGAIHILDLVLPDKASVARSIARADRGDYPRPAAEWRRIFSEEFMEVLFEPYSLRSAGVTLWQMVYFQGKARG